MSAWTILLISNLVLSFASFMARVLPQPLKRGLYRVRPLAGLIRSSLNRAAPQEMAEVRVAAGPLEGMRLLLDLHNEKDYWLGTYEPELQAAVAELVQPGQVVFDVGANIGYVTLLLAQAAGSAGQVFAFEALPENVRRLRQNLALNSIGSRVTPVEAAVVDRPGSVSFLVGPSHGMGKASGSAGREGVRYAETIAVPGLCLDDFVFGSGRPAPHVVKMDIEGGEVLALPGMRRVLEEARPVMLMELHGPQAASVAWEILVGTGYRICRMAAGFPAVPSFEALDWKAYLVALPPAHKDV